VGCDCDEQKVLDLGYMFIAGSFA